MAGVGAAKVVCIGLQNSAAETAMIAGRAFASDAAAAPIRVPTSINASGRTESPGAERGSPPTTIRSKICTPDA